MNRDTRLRLCIRLLGGFEVEPINRVVSGTEPQQSLPIKAQALLAFLAAEPGRWHARDQLADLLWPTLIPAAGRNNLRQVLLSLHRLLCDQDRDAPCVECNRRSVRLAPRCDHCIDLVDFGADSGAPPEGVDDELADRQLIEALSQRIALYRGELLAGIELEQCEDYSSWLQIEREALRRRAVSMCERLVQTLNAQNRHDQALQFAQRLVVLDPLSDEGHRSCMRLLALTGQPAAALAQYETYRRALDDELGVLPDIRTRQLSKEIAAGQHQPVPAAAPPEPKPHQGSAIVSERRQVTALYCQFVCPTEEDPDDPEALLDLLNQQVQYSRSIIGAHSGHVVRTQDGGVLAYFGYPQALEQAAIQAVRAGLELAADTASGFSRRIGVHTGLIITGTDPTVPDTLGRTSRLASHLRLCGEPNQVVVSASTRRLAMGYFHWSSLGPFALPDDTTSYEIFRAVSETDASSRVKASESLTRFVGRARELATCARSWEAAVAGRGQALMLTGEAGIGKSRLVHTFRQGIPKDSHYAFELTCLPEFSRIPFHPLRRFVQHHCACQRDQERRLRAERLAKGLQALWPLVPIDRIDEVFTTLLEQPLEAGETQNDTRAEVPRQQQQQTRVINAFGELLSRLTASRPLLLVVEDVHWSDPSTLQMLDLTLSRMKQQRILAILLARQAPPLAWSAEGLTRLELEPLGALEMKALVENQVQKLESSDKDWIMERANGNPLFAEELAQVYRDQGSVKGNIIPSSLRDLLMARLDQISGAKNIVQLAAVLGGQFEFDQLKRLCAQPEEQVVRAVQLLRDTRILTGSIDKGFAFRHALYRETAYQSLVKADRRRAHRRIAELISSGEFAATPPAILAQHWEGAGNPEAAMRAWTQAGGLANHQGAHREALSHFKAAPVLKDQTKTGCR